MHVRIRTSPIAQNGEMVAFRTALELIKSLRYKLHTMRVPLSGPAVVFGDNKSVVNSVSIPEVKLLKKHLGICYHAVREASAARIWKVGFVKGKYNIANCLTKILSGLRRIKSSTSGCTGSEDPRFEI